MKLPRPLQCDEQLSSVLKIMEEVVWAASLPDHAMLFITPSVEKLYGFSAEECMADCKHWERVVYPDDIAVIAAIYTQIATTGRYDEEYRIISTDGRLKWVRHRGAVSVDAAGVPTRVDGMIADITRSKESAFELQATRELLHQMGDIARIGCWELDVRADRLRWSEVMYELLDVDPGVVPDLARAISFFKAGSARDTLRGALDAGIEQGLPFDLELECVTATGRELWVRVSGRPVVEAGRCVKIRGALQDISERKRAEQELRIKEAVIAGAPVGIVVTEARRPDSPVVYVNAAEERISGYSREELLGRDLRFFQDDDREQAGLKTLRQALEEGRPCQVELRNYHKDGRRYEIELRVAPVLDPNGRLTHFVGIQTDVTARNLAAAKQAQLFAAIEQASDVIVITDIEGAILYVNPAFTVHSGYTPEEVLGRNPRLLTSGKQDQAIYEAMWTTIHQGEVWQGRFVNRKKDGTLYTVETTISPVRNAAGAVINFVAVQRDITKQLALETQLVMTQKLEVVGRLTSGIAHDFNNTLQAILGYTEFALTNTATDYALYTFLDEIRAAAQRSATLTRQLMGFARGHVLMPRVLDLNASVESLITMLRRLIREDITLIWEPEQVLCQAAIDPTHLDQILTNLVINARDAISGVGTITISTENVVLTANSALQDGLPPGAFVLLSVRDDGSGMDAATQAQIFEPFYTTKPVGRGTGLGLTTVQSIVTENKGFIRVVSAPWAGTSIRVYLPQAVGSEAVPATPVATPLQQGTETVLLVEDDAAVRDLGIRMLKRLGYTVLSAATPSAARNLAETYLGPIHLLITDMVMPEMHGRDLARQIATLRPDIAWLLMSGHTADIIAPGGGVDIEERFIQKPFTITEFASRVRQALERRKMDIPATRSQERCML